MSPQSESSAIASVEEIIVEIRAGRMVVLVDDEDRENEGDIILAADHVTPEAINFMVTHARGLVCLTITEARARQLGLVQMAHDNTSPNSTAFTTSIEAAEGVTTGISAYDRHFLDGLRIPYHSIIKFNAWNFSKVGGDVSIC